MGLEDGGLKIARDKNGQLMPAAAVQADNQPQRVPSVVGTGGALAVENRNPAEGYTPVRTGPQTLRADDGMGGMRGEPQQSQFTAHNNTNDPAKIFAGGALSAATPAGGTTQAPPQAAPSNGGVLKFSYSKSAPAGNMAHGGSNDWTGVTAAGALSNGRDYNEQVAHAAQINQATSMQISPKDAINMAIAKAGPGATTTQINAAADMFLAQNRQDIAKTQQQQGQALQIANIKSKSDMYGHDQHLAGVKYNADAHVKAADIAGDARVNQALAAGKKGAAEEYDKANKYKIDRADYWRKQMMKDGESISPEVLAAEKSRWLKQRGIDASKLTPEAVASIPFSAEDAIKSRVDEDIASMGSGSREAKLAQADAKAKQLSALYRNMNIPTGTGTTHPLAVPMGEAMRKAGQERRQLQQQRS